MHQALADAKQEAQAVMGAMFKLAALEMLETRIQNQEAMEDCGDLSDPAVLTDLADMPSAEVIFPDGTKQTIYSKQFPVIP